METHHLWGLVILAPLAVYIVVISLVIHLTRRCSRLTRRERELRASVDALVRRERERRET